MKRFFTNNTAFLSVIFILLGSTISSAQTVPVGGLVARYTFDNSYLNWSSSTGEVIESIGATTGDAFSLSASNVISGQINEGLNFTGTQYISAPSATPFVAYNTDYTVSAWVYLVSEGTNYTIFSKASNAAKEMSFFVNTSRRLSAFVGGNTVTGNAVIPLNQWTHVALTNNDVTNQYSIYVNGVLDKTGTSGTITSSGIDFLIGARRNNSNSDSNIRFVGRLDDIRIYNRVLNATEITAIATMNDISDPGSNNPPIADAGSDQGIQLPTNSITLSGSGTDGDGTIVSYAWTKLSGGSATITNPSSASTTVTDLVESVYTFRLTVTDDDGGSDIDDVIVSVTTNPPICPAKKIVVLGSSTAFGTGASPISNSWVNLFTNFIKQLNPSNSTVNYGTSTYTTYHILPTGTSIPVNRPTIDIAKNMTQALNQNPHGIIINMPSNDTANGYSISEQQDNYKLLVNTALSAGVPVWLTTTQPRNLGATARTELMTMRDWIQATFPLRNLDFWTTIANTDGTINATYNAGDGIHLNNAGHAILGDRTQNSNIMNVLCGESGIDIFPTVNAGLDQTINLPTTSTTLTGVANDTDGSIVSYLWSKISGASANIVSPTSATTSITALAEGDYVFRLTVADDKGATVSDDIQISVVPGVNIPPTISSAVVSTITLTSSASDADGTITYEWTKISGGSASFGSPNSATTTVSNLQQGSYVFRLTVTDNNGATATSDIPVTI